MEKQVKPAREYFGKKNSDIINFPIQLRKDVFSPNVNKELLKAPIMTARILFKVLNDISNDQFQQERQRGQFALFEEEFLNENNVVARFTFDVSDIDEHRDYKAIENGLQFLENLDKDWHKTVNSKGKMTKAYGGVIIQPNISESKVTFLMSNYWINKFMNLGVYNPVFFETAWRLTKMRQVLFYLWLLEVNRKHGKTKIKYQTFNESYDYNYKSAQHIGKHVLKGLRDKLNVCANVSFNYSTKGDLIHITTYYVKDVDLDIKKDTITKQKITQKLHYWKTRYGLSEKHISSCKTMINLDLTVFTLFQKAHDSIVEDCKKLKKKTTDYQGDEFIELFQQKIIDFYRSSPWFKSNPNGYPIIDAKFIDDDVEILEDEK